MKKSHMYNRIRPESAKFVRFKIIPAVVVAVEEMDYESEFSEKERKWIAEYIGKYNSNTGFRGTIDQLNKFCNFAREILGSDMNLLFNGWEEILDRLKEESENDKEKFTKWEIVFINNVWFEKRKNKPDRGPTIGQFSTMLHILENRLGINKWA